MRFCLRHLRGDEIQRQVGDAVFVRFHLHGGTAWRTLLLRQDWNIPRRLTTIIIKTWQVSRYCFAHLPACSGSSWSCGPAAPSPGAAEAVFGGPSTCRLCPLRCCCSPASAGPPLQRKNIKPSKKANERWLTFVFLHGWGLFPLFGFRSSASCVYRVSSHRVRSVDPVQFEIQATSVAHHFPFVVPPPNGRRLRATIGTRQVYPFSHSRSSL